MSNESKKPNAGPGGNRGPNAGPGTNTKPGGATPGTGTKPGAGSGSPTPGRVSDAQRSDERNAGSGPGSNAPTGAKPGTGTNAGESFSVAEIMGQAKAPNETFVIVDAPKPNKGGRPKGFSPKAAKVETAIEAHAINVEIANGLTDVMNGIATKLIGDYAAMTDDQRKGFIDPLVRVMDRLAPSALDNVQKYADPALIIVSLAGWLATIAAERQKYPAQRMAAATPQPANVPDDLPTGQQVVTPIDPAIVAGMGGGL